jgi:hypothetical protein
MEKFEVEFKQSMRDFVRESVKKGAIGAAGGCGVRVAGGPGGCSALRELPVPVGRRVNSLTRRLSRPAQVQELQKTVPELQASQQKMQTQYRD